MADDRPSSELESREPTVEDLRDLCRELNLRGAKYVVIGGFAMRAANYNRRTMDVDLVVAVDLENEAKVVTHREKDAGDLVFLRHWFAERGEEPPCA
jgi:phosphoserine phosphatase